jgi:hypothetical protein
MNFLISGAGRYFGPSIETDSRRFSFMEFSLVAWAQQLCPTVAQV